MKKNIKKYIGEKGSFRRNSLIMSSGAMVNVLIAFFLMPIVTRLFDKKEFGVFYIFSSIVAISTLIINGMYPHALVVPKERKDFLALLKLCFVMTGVGIVIFSLFIIVGGQWFLKLINGEEIGNYIYLLPISLLFSTLNVIFINWNVRRKEFKKNASSTIVSSITMKGTQIAYGTMVSGSFPGLIFSDIATKLSATIALASKKMKNDLDSFKSISNENLKKIAKEYIKYPTFLLSANFVNKFSGDIPLYLFSTYFGLGAVGAFGFANQMLNIPFTIIGNSIAPVYFQRANELFHQDIDRLRHFTLSSYHKMLILGCLAFGFIFAFGDLIFRFVFGTDWMLAGQMAMILSAYYVFKLISSPFARIFRVVRKEEITLSVNVFLAVLRILSMIVAIYFKSVFIAVGFFSLANLIGYTYNNLQVFKVLEIDRNIILKKTIFISIPIFTGFFLLRMFFNTIFNI